MLWLTRDTPAAGDRYILWRAKPLFVNGNWACTRIRAHLVLLKAGRLHRECDIRLPPGKDGICRVDMALTRRA